LVSRGGKGRARIITGPVTAFKSAGVPGGVIAPLDVGRAENLRNLTAQQKTLIKNLPAIERRVLSQMRFNPQVKESAEVPTASPSGGVILAAANRIAEGRKPQTVVPKEGKLSDIGRFGLSAQEVLRHEILHQTLPSSLSVEQQHAVIPHTIAQEKARPTPVPTRSGNRPGRGTSQTSSITSRRRRLRRTTPFGLGVPRMR
jgi:hypothetical protein